MKHLIKLLVITLTLLWVPSGSCGDLSIVFGGWSKHVGTHPNNDGYYYKDGDREVTELNEVNPTYGITVNEWTYATSVLSYKNRGYSVFYTLEPDWWKWTYAEIGIRLGGTYGYAHTPVKLLIAPIISPVIEIRPIKQFSIELGVMPHIETAVFTANLKINII